MNCLKAELLTKVFQKLLLKNSGRQRNWHHARQAPTPAPENKYLVRTNPGFPFIFFVLTLDAEEHFAILPLKINFLR